MDKDPNNPTAVLIIAGTILPGNTPTAPSQFRPTKNELPKTNTTGKLVPDKSSTGQTGTMSFVINVTTSFNFIFTPYPPGSYPATYFDDLNPNAPISGLYIPSQTSGLPDKFRPKDPKQLKPSESHGKVVPDQQNGTPAKTGTMGSAPIAPNQDVNFIPDAPNTVPGVIQYLNISIDKTGYFKLNVKSLTFSDIH